jgi:Ca2+-binding RTX toxin-like protein
VLTGNSGANTLTGGDGNDTLSGGSNSDTMIGGLGNDTYVVAQAGDVVTELAGEGVDLVQAGLTYTLGNHVENLTLTGSSNFGGTGNALNNVIVGNGGGNALNGGDGDDTLDGGSGTDSMTGGQGNDIYFVNVSTDTTNESAGQGIDTVNSSVTRTLTADIELLFLTGTSTINGTGNASSNLLRGNGMNNTLQGNGGIDILEGGLGTDTLQNTSGGKTLFNGGGGTDTLTGTSNNDMLIGGANNDTITTGSGADIIAFNRGDGMDTVAVSTTRDNTLSIGGGAVYSDLLFQKNGNDLIIHVSGTDRVTFTGYYSSTSNRSVNTLQVVIEGTSDYDAGSGDAMRNKIVQSFNFEGLVAAFDAARAANPSLTTWALTNALLAQHLSGSDTAALGGDLAYRYGRFGTLSDISFTPAIGILSAAGFGTSAQTLQSLAVLQDSTARLG